MPEGFSADGPTHRHSALDEQPGCSVGADLQKKTPFCKGDSRQGLGKQISFLPFRIRYPPFTKT